MRRPDAGSETGIAEERKEAILEIPHYIKIKSLRSVLIVEMFDQTEISQRVTNRSNLFLHVFVHQLFTIIAAYKLYLPSADGKLPGTTTEPAGTLP